MDKKDLLLYAVTDRSWLDEGETLEEQVEKCLKGGATCIQLREKHLSEEEFLDKMKSKGIKLAALSSYYHSSEKKKKYENIYVMNYSFVDCEKMEYVAKMITQVE